MKFDEIINYILNEKITGGLSDGMTAQDLAKKFKVPLKQIQDQIEKGIKVEFEHTNDKEIARKIAMDHMAEGMLDYYDRLKKMEDEAKIKTEMVAADVVGGSPSAGGGMAPQDKISYAPGDSRMPKSLFTTKTKKDKKRKMLIQRRPRTGM